MLVNTTETTKFATFVAPCNGTSTFSNKSNIWRSKSSTIPRRKEAPKCALPFSRRDFISAISASVIGSALLKKPQLAQAFPGLRLFPVQEPLTNNYFLMRACETTSDRRKVVNSNPVNKLSLDMHGLTPTGVNQAISASRALYEAGLETDAWIWPSVTISAFETAEILASNLRIRRERIVPEFSFLDSRGVGRLDGGEVENVRRVLVENDSKDSSWRPLPGEDGTPNESTDDVFVRIRQLVSKLETQYFGENIVIVSPDSDPLSILEAALTGVDLLYHHNLEYSPGEVRLVKELVVDMEGNVKIKPRTNVLAKPYANTAGQTQRA